MRHLPAALCLAALVALMGCDAFTSEVDELRLTPDRAQYSAGQEAVVVLDNHGERTFTYSSCGPYLERQEGAAWSPLLTVPRVCVPILVGVRPTEVITFRHDLSDGLASGTYRFALAVGRGEVQDDRVASGAFRVVD